MEDGWAGNSRIWMCLKMSNLCAKRQDKQVICSAFAISSPLAFSSNALQCLSFPIGGALNFVAIFPVDA